VSDRSGHSSERKIKMHMSFAQRTESGLQYMWKYLHERYIYKNITSRPKESCHVLDHLRGEYHKADGIHNTQDNEKHRNIKMMQRGNLGLHSSYAYQNARMISAMKQHPRNDTVGCSLVSSA